jgi:hypothetical protein
MADGAAEIRALAHDLGEIADNAYDDVDKVFFKGAMNVKNEMIADVSKSPHFKGMAGAITFEHQNTRGVIKRVIGPDKSRRGGSLGNIYYFGTSRGGGSGDIEKPLRSEEPRLMNALEALAAKWAGQL